MKKCLLAIAIACVATPAIAQSFPGNLVAEYYMNEFSIPKGWTLSYQGKDGSTEVFVMDRDLDAFPQTSFLQPIDQIRRVMCGDDSLKAVVNGGTVIRVDARDKQNGKIKVTKGAKLERC